MTMLHLSKKASRLLLVLMLAGAAAPEFAAGQTGQIPSVNKISKKLSPKQAAIMATKPMVKPEVLRLYEVRNNRIYFKVKPNEEVQLMRPELMEYTPTPAELARSLEVPQDVRRFKDYYNQPAIRNMESLKGPNLKAGTFIGKRAPSGQIMAMDSKPPVIDNFLPKRGKHGDILTIRGAGLDKVSEVRLGDFKLNIRSKTRDTINADVLAPGGTHNVVLVWDGGKVTSKGDFTVYFEPMTSSPAVSSFSPERGKHGDVITIKGERLDRVSDVRLGDFSLKIKSKTRDTITAEVFGPGGNHKVVLVWDGGTVASRGDFGIYFEPMTLSCGTSVDRRNRQSSIKAQGRRNTCVAFASMAALEAKLGTDIDLNENYAYYKLKRDSKSRVCEDEGISNRDDWGGVFKTNKICEESYWPYVAPESELGCPTPGEWPTVTCGDNAEYSVREHQQIFRNNNLEQDTGEYINNPKYLESLLCAGYDIVASVALAGWPQGATGVIDAVQGADISGYHAMLIVGYNRNDDENIGGGYFIVKNSWGADKGQEGYVYLSYDYLRLYGSVGYYLLGADGPPRRRRAQ